MGKRNTISNLQMQALLITTIIGVGILSLPSDVADISNTSGWVLILLGGIIVLPFIIITDKIFKYYPEKNFFEIGKEVMPAGIFNIILLVALINFTITMSFVSRMFAEVLKAYLLETTPVGVIILTILLATAYLARCKLEVLVRVSVITLPIIVAFIIFLIIVNLPNSDYTNLYPLFDLNYKTIPKGIGSVIFSYSGYEILFMALPFVDNKRDSLKYNIKGLLLVIIIYLLVFFVTLSQYGIHQLKREIWPTIAVIKELNLPGYFLENLDGIAMAVWVIVVYGTMGPVLYTSGMILANISKVRDHKPFVPFLIPPIYIISLLPRNLVQLNEIMGKILNYFSTFTIFIVPIIILILAYIKRGRVKR